MSKLESRPFDLEPMTAPVDDPRELHAALDIREGPARKNGEPDERIGCQTSKCFPDLGIEPHVGRTACDSCQRPVEVEDQNEACPRLNLGLEAVLEAAIGGFVRSEAAQCSLAPRFSTGRRVRSLRRRPAHR